MPTKQANGKYKTNLRYPQKFRELTDIKSDKFQKTFATKQLAVKAEKDMKKKIAKALREENANALEIKGNMKFKEFYQSKWFPRYELGRTGKIPSDITIQNTKNLFRFHILLLFGEYAMNYLNANIKILKSYIRSMFDIAEILGYIEFNRTTKNIQSITAPKKITLAEKSY